jgi:acetyl-CoA carboxylase carboxyltransferase component
MVERAYEHGQAINVAAHFEIDDVIDPAVTRARVVHALQSAPAPVAREGKRRPFVDTW